MRKLWAIALSAIVLTGMAGAQGINDGLKNPDSNAKNPGGKMSDTIKDFKKTGTSGPGFVQEDFVNNLGGNINETFGEKKGELIFDNFKKSDTSSEEMVDLMNGKMSKKDIKKKFGVGQKSAKKIEEDIEEAVDDKNKKMFFGIIIVILVGEHGIDPKGDFAQQVASSRDEISEEDFKKLLENQVTSKKFMDECFGFGHKEDQKLMSDACKELFNSKMVMHPMAESMGFDSKKFNSDDFMQLGKGMPGFGGDFEGGMAGGMPFPTDLPPMPFMGENMGDFFENCKPPEEGGESPEAPAEGESE